jgi:hypothetical protein
VDKWAKFEITPISEFEQVARENEYFFWHFVSKDVLGLSIIPLGADYGNGNSLELIRESLGVKIYQSFTEDSIDFLINLGLPSKKIKDGAFYVPSFFGFHRRRMVESTIDHCYCREGITEIIFKTNPSFFESFLSIEEEDLK